ncbi:hypothetical protein EVAR_22885_1 [Eumeta japonica]|uniref:Uncharacterized protein n=1 Tax=Eumeta variegata TaxID=151549 RepID=A0A4C1UU73_EUMVA|nr:hypothetical protein EVAR_22885_1 [Eumeta japonica]
MFAFFRGGLSHGQPVSCTSAGGPPARPRPAPTAPCRPPFGASIQHSKVHLVKTCQDAAEPRDGTLAHNQCTIAVITFATFTVRFVNSLRIVIAGNRNTIYIYISRFPVGHNALVRAKTPTAVLKYYIRFDKIALVRPRRGRSARPAPAKDRRKLERERTP